MCAKHILIYSRYSNQHNKWQFFVFRRSLVINDLPQIPRGTFIYNNGKKNGDLFYLNPECIVIF